MQKNIIITFLIVSVTAMFISGCSDYRRILKSDDIELKYEKAIEYYEGEDYFRAIQLFNELLTYFRGSQRAEQIYYYFAYSHYGQGNYILASHYFQNFVRTFPRSKYAEEAMFMAAYCQYLNSPTYSLDQTYTRNAIRGMQAFINQYPSSERLPQANEVIDKLRAKLQKKSFETARLYFLLEEYTAAVTAFGTHLQDYPDSEYREQAYYLTFKAHYLFASKSIEARQKERYQEAIEAYEVFASRFPDSPFKRSATGYYETAQRELNKLIN